MDKSNNFFNFITLYQAYQRCRKNKRRTQHALKFEERMEKELCQLEKELQAKNYHLSKSICFVVTEPTTREVFAASFRDRVVHHLLCGFLEPIFETKFDQNSFACRKDKGTHKAVKTLQKFLRLTGAENGKILYFLHLDIKAFFMSLKKEILLNIIYQEIREPDWLWLAKIIIDHDPTQNFFCKSSSHLMAKVPEHKSLFHLPKGQGLPIGNLTSQFFANVYLNNLDQFIKRRLRAKYYLRYADDILLLSPDKKQLLAWKKEIKEFLEIKLQLQLNDKKQVLQEVERGIDWLGYIVRPNCILVRPRVIKNFKRKLFYLNKDLAMWEKEDKSQINQSKLEKILAVVNSYFGFFKHADSYKLRKKLWEKDFGLIGKYLEPKKYPTLRPKSDLDSFVLKPEFLKQTQGGSDNSPFPSGHSEQS